jgi:hypothetical protein
VTASGKSRMKSSALAALLFALSLVGCGSEDADETVAQPSTVTVTETVTETETVPAEPKARCSTAHLRVTLPAQELPAKVAEVRERVFEAAAVCDYHTLEQIALEQGEGFTFSYGSSSFGGGPDASDYWRKVEEESIEQPKPMEALVTILTLPYTRNEAGSYAWPTVYDENPTEEAWRALVASGLYSQDEVDFMRTPGYLGYRTAITADGDWQFFVAGD